MIAPPSRPESLAFAALVAFAVLAPTSPASAQIFVGGDRGAVAMPIPTPGPADVPAAEAPAHETLRFLPNTLDGLRLSGEVGDLRWPVYLTGEQASAPLRFRVGYVSAVSILPEASTIDVRINDHSIGTDAIDASRGLRTIEFAVPADLLKPGYNAVSLSVRQRHRVDCSVAATYELWTRIDPSVTGLVLPSGTPGAAALSDIPALLPRADGGMPIHIVLSSKTNPAHLRQLIVATQRISIAAHALQPVVDFTPAAVDPYGVDLVLGTRDRLRTLSRIADALGTSGPLTTLLPAAKDGRPTLLVTGSNEREVDEAIARLTPSDEALGTPSGLRVLANYPAKATSGASRIPLHDLDVRGQDFSGRFLRKSFNLSLPADFLAADYGRGTFDLAGAYASGLTQDAQVRVDINGRSSGVIKLFDTAGDVFQHKQLFLPLSLLRPGFNRVDIFAETPRPEDATCSADDSKRFLFLDTSEIVLPPLARVQRLPDLAVTTSGGLPFTHGTAHLVVPKPERETMGAALSLTTRAAVAAGTIIPFDFSTKVSDDASGSTLVVSPAQALDPALMTTIGLDPKTVEMAWHRASTPQPVPTQQNRWWLTRTDGPSACRLPAQIPVKASDVSSETRAVVPAITNASATDSDDMLEAWGGDKPVAPGWRDRIAGVPAAITTWMTSATSVISWRSEGTRNEGIDPNASLILAQGMSHGSAGNVTTIVTAPDADTLRASVTCLFDPQVWSKIHGRLAVIDASNGAVTATDATSFRYLASDKSSLSNSRLVVAGWFSLNPLAFVSLALLTALCLGGTTMWFVRGVGRRSE